MKPLEKSAESANVRRTKTTLVDTCVIRGKNAVGLFQPLNRHDVEISPLPDSSAQSDPEALTPSANFLFVKLAQRCLRNQLKRDTVLVVPAAQIFHAFKKGFSQASDEHKSRPMAKFTRPRSPKLPPARSSSTTHILLGQEGSGFN